MNSATKLIFGGWFLVCKWLRQSRLWAWVRGLGLYCFEFRVRVLGYIGWVVVKIRVPFGLISTIRHLIFRVPKKGP